MLGLFAFSPALQARENDRDCSLIREAPEGLTVPIRLTCTANVSSELLFELVRDPLHQAKALSSLGERTRMLNAESDHHRVLQFHESRLIADREVVVEWRVTGTPEARKVAWRIDEDQSGSSTNKIIPGQHEGHWLIGPDPRGTKLTYYVKYLPGGHVPDRMVKRFIAKGVRRVVAEMVDYTRRIQRARSKSQLPKTSE